MKHVFVFLLFFLVGILATAFYKHSVAAHLSETVKTPVSTFIPFSLKNPPPSSLKGIIITFSPLVEWQAREATIPAELVIKKPVVQGEDFWTGEKGGLDIVFSHIGTLQIQANTHISFIQTLPESFVVLQDSGKTTYINTGIHQISVRMPPILVQQSKGQMTVEKDTDTGQILISVSKGEVMIAFNDTDNISTIVKVEEGNLYTFDRETRTGEINEL